MTGFRKSFSCRMAGWILALSATMTLPAIAEDRMAQLFSGSQDQMCFARQYDANHLKKIPGQHVTAIRASVVRNKPPAEGVSLRVRFQLRGGQNPVDVVGSCEWSATGNFDPSGKPLLPTYPKKEGFACIAMFSSASAEEGGTILFDIPTGGKTNVLHFDDQVGVWVDTNPDKAQKRLQLGKDDRVFRLERVSDVNCASLNAQMRID